MTLTARSRILFGQTQVDAVRFIKEIDPKYLERIGTRWSFDSGATGCARFGRNKYRRDGLLFKRPGLKNAAVKSSPR